MMPQLCPVNETMMHGTFVSSRGRHRTDQFGSKRVKYVFLQTKTNNE